MALERLYNVTYQGILADLPATLPGGSFFIAKDTKEVYGYDENDLPFLINCCGGDGSTCINSTFNVIKNIYQGLFQFDILDFTAEENAQFIRLNALNIQSGYRAPVEGQDYVTRLEFLSDTVPSGPLGIVLTLSEFIRSFKYAFSWNPSNQDGTPFIYKEYLQDGTVLTEEGKNSFLLGFQISTDGVNWSQECIWGTTYNRS